MPTNDQPLSHGLQEWAVCCRALGEGRLILTVRKGGIHERGGGLFALEQQRFALMPTYLHQDATREHQNATQEHQDATQEHRPRPVRDHPGAAGSGDL